MVCVHVSIDGAAMVLSQYLSTKGAVHASHSYSFMYRSVQCNSIYEPQEEPSSPDSDDECTDKQRYDSDTPLPDDSDNIPAPKKEIQGVEDDSGLMRRLLGKENALAGTKQLPCEKPAVNAKLVVAVALSSRGTCALGYNSEGGNQVRMHAIRSSENGKAYPMHKSTSIFKTAFWNENIVILGSKGWVRYWDCSKGVPYDYVLPACIPDALAVQEKGFYAIISASSCAHGHRFYFFRPAEGSKVTVWPVSRKDKDKIEKTGVSVLAPHPSRDSFAVATENNNVQLWNIVETEKEGEWVLPGLSMQQKTYQKLTALAYHDSCVIGASSRGNIIWWDSSSGELIDYRIDCHRDKITSLKHIKDKIYASGSQDGTVKLWDVRKIKVPSKVVPHGFPVAALNTCNYRTLSACSKNGVVKFWNILGI